MNKILIIEDDAAYGLTISNWAKKNGYEPTHCMTMELAKKEILRQNFRIALTDLRLPDGDGIMLLAWIKDKRPDVQVIVMTSYAEIQSAVSAIKLGAFDYLEKPVNPRILKEKIERAMQNAPLPRRGSPYRRKTAGRRRRQGRKPGRQHRLQERARPRNNTVRLHPDCSPHEHVGPHRRRAGRARNMPPT